MIPFRHDSTMARRSALLAVAVAALLQAACSQPTATILPSSPALNLEEPFPAGGQSALRVARVTLSGEPGTIVIPPVAVVNEPLDAVVTTHGGGCVGEDTTVVDVRGLVADVVPYQRVYHPRANELCTAELLVNRRQLKLVFAEPGIATVRVFGRGAGDSLVVVTRRVAVR